MKELLRFLSAEDPDFWEVSDLLSSAGSLDCGWMIGSGFEEKTSSGFLVGGWKVMPSTFAEGFSTGLFWGKV
jgi:hypothetical protein